MEAFIKYGTGALAVLALVLGVFAFNRPESPQLPPSGSVTGPDSYFDYYNTNGVFTYHRLQASLYSATTTPCVIKSPSATTTLAAFAMNVTTPTSTTALFTLATSTVPNATTSLIATQTLTSGQEGTFNWAAGANNGLVSPNTYVSIGTSGGVSPFTYGGSCNATFRGVGTRN